MASSVEIASHALDHIINTVFVDWAGREPDSSTRPTVLLRQLNRNMVVWFNKTPPAYEALEAFYLSCNPTKLPAFLMFLWIGAMSGGLASIDRTRDIAEDLEDDLRTWMNHMAKSSPEQQKHHDKINRGVVEKMAARVLDRMLVLDKGDLDLAKGVGAVTIVAPIPPAEIGIQKDMVLIANYAIKTLMLEGNPEANRIALRDLRNFAAGVVPCDSSSGSDTGSSSDTAVEAPGTPNDTEAYKKMAAEAIARAAGAEQIAEAAEQRTTTAEKKAAALEKRMAALENTMAAMNRKLAAAEHKAKMDSGVVSDLGAVVAVMADKVASVVKEMVSAPRIIQLPPPPPPTPAPGSRIMLSSLETTTKEHAGMLKKLVAEMGWIMPQFRMMFYERWNGVMAQWQLQQQFATAFVPTPEFVPFV